MGFRVFQNKTRGEIPRGRNAGPAGWRVEQGTEGDKVSQLALLQRPEGGQQHSTEKVRGTPHSMWEGAMGDGMCSYR